MADGKKFKVIDIYSSPVLIDLDLIPTFEEVSWVDINAFKVV